MPMGGEAELHQLVQARLGKVDQRYTVGRRRIVELLVGAGRPVSISDIAGHLPELPRSSAYRHLVDLEAAGVVRRVAGNDEFSRYELAEELTEHHHHLLCEGCGQVVDVTPSKSFEATVRRAVTDLAGAAGFQPHSHRLDILGLCAACCRPRPPGEAGRP